MSSSGQSNCGAFTIDALSNGIPVISSRSAGLYIEACMVCFDSQGHQSGVEMVVKTDMDTKQNCYNVTWGDIVTDRLRLNFGGNHNKTTENGATAIALILIRELTEFTAIQEAFIGSTVDYFLTSKEIDDTLIFNGTEAYCEVRGIREEKKGNTVKGALAQKTKRLNPPENLPTYIVIVEFAKPFSRIAIR